MGRMNMFIEKKNQNEMANHQKIVLLKWNLSG